MNAKIIPFKSQKPEQTTKLPSVGDFALGAMLVTVAPVFGPLYALAIYGDWVRSFSSVLPSSYLKEYIDGKFGN